ncbi:MAG: FxLYD domain-containing protein [Candidatus Helarchaeota archaeon]
MKKLYLMIVFLLIGVFLSGCTITGNFFINPEKEVKKTMIEYYETTVNAYSLNEEILSLELINKSYATGDFQLIIKSRLNFINNLNNLIKLKNNISDCNEKLGPNVCNYLDNVAKCYYYTNTVFYNITEIKILNNKAEVKIKHTYDFYKFSEDNNLKIIKDRKTSQKTYYLIYKNNSWKIYDLSQDSKLYSKQKEEILNNFNISLNKFNEHLNKLSFLVKDKCAQIIFDDSLSSVEKENEMTTCYYGKYLNIVKTEEDIEICNEISDEFFRGLCYGYISFNIDKVNFCDSVPNDYYSAKGYYDDLNTKDLCYYSYAINKASLLENVGEVCTNIDNEQLKEDCLEIFGYSLDNLDSRGNLCIPSWSCDSWSECSIEGIKTRTCVDKKGCKEPITEKEYCTYTPKNPEIVSSSIYYDALGWLHIVGEVKNIDSIPIEYIKIIITCYDTSGTVVQTDFTYADVDILNSGEVAPFQSIIFSNIDKIDNCDLQTSARKV